MELSASPLGYLDALMGAEPGAVNLGRTQVDGVEVTVYGGTIDPRRALAAARPEDRETTEQRLVQAGFGRFSRSTPAPYDTRPFRAWIDDDRIVRRMELTLLREIPDNVYIQPTVTIDYVDLGGDVTVELPPAGSVRPMIDVLVDSMRGGG